MNSESISDAFSPLKSLKGIKDSFGKEKTISKNMPQNEFKTKLRFEPSGLSTAILKKYLLIRLSEMEPETLLNCEPPSQYSKDPDNLTDYQVLKDLCLMSVKDWKLRLAENHDDVECLYLSDDSVSTDSKYFYDRWRIIQEEVGNHEKQMSFFRLVSEIVGNLNNRNFVDISMDGEAQTVPTVDHPTLQSKSLEAMSPLIPMKALELNIPTELVRTNSDELLMESCFDAEDDETTIPGGDVEVNLFDTV